MLSKLPPCSLCVYHHKGETTNLCTVEKGFPDTILHATFKKGPDFLCFQEKDPRNKMDPPSIDYEQLAKDLK